MITILYPPSSKELSGWEDRLNGISLAYLLIKQDDIVEPEMKDGEKIIKGVAEIEKYLGGLEVFVNAWYEDRCDLYEFEK